MDRKKQSRSDGWLFQGAKSSKKCLTSEGWLLSPKVTVSALSIWELWKFLEVGLGSMCQKEVLWAGGSDACGFSTIIYSAFHSVL